jgi:hypothetical protein
VSDKWGIGGATGELAGRPGGRTVHGAFGLTCGLEPGKHRPGGPGSKRWPDLSSPGTVLPGQRPDRERMQPRSRGRGRPWRWTLFAVSVALIVLPPVRSFPYGSSATVRDGIVFMSEVVPHHTSTPIPSWSVFGYRGVGFWISNGPVLSGQIVEDWGGTYCFGSRGSIPPCNTYTSASTKTTWVGPDLFAGVE